MSAVQPLVGLKQLRKAFGAQLLLDGIDLTIAQGRRIGLIGRNGEGKSTLLQIIAGTVPYDDGEITVRRGAKIAYLPQAPSFEPDHTVYDVVASGIGEQSALLATYQQTLDSLASDSCSDSALNRLARLQGELEQSGIWQCQVRIETAISKLGLDGKRDVGELSGGWQRRTALAKALVAEPDLLLLDEPTNHLDVSAIEWLEDFIADFNGAVLFITHDRYFLDAVAEEIVELDRGHIRHFTCSYPDYLQKKQELLAQEQRQWDKFDNLLANEEAWIRQGIPARRTRDEGRVRRLHDLRQQRADRRLHGSDVTLHVASGLKPGKILIDAQHLHHSFGQQKILSDFTLRIMAGDRIGLVGPNGIGKTTLLKILLAELKADNGTVKHGARLVPAFLEQMRSLDPQLTLRDVLLPNGGNYVFVGGHESRHVYSYLQDFMFDKEKLRARVGMLSGGERGRLLLARLLLEPANLLVLDEPTNDLDIGTIAVLEHALTTYAGTVLLVSHDRAFMDRVVERVLAFEGKGEVVAIEGGWSDYVAWKGRRIAEQSNRVARETSSPTSVKPQKGHNKLSYRDQRELDEMPAKIEKLEEQRGEWEALFCQPEYYSQDAAVVAESRRKFKLLEEELVVAYARWQALEEKRESLSGA